MSYQTRFNPGSPSMVVKPECNAQINKYISLRSDTCTGSLLYKKSTPSAVFQIICCFDNGLKAEKNSKKYLQNCKRLEEKNMSLKVYVKTASLIHCLEMSYYLMAKK